MRRSATKSSALPTSVVNIMSGVGVVHRAKTAGRDFGGGIEHGQITGIDHVISGNGTRHDRKSERYAGQQPGRHDPERPSRGGGTVIGGVIIPPNTPHWWTEVTTDRIAGLVVGVDPHKVLPAGYVLK